MGDKKNKKTGYDRRHMVGISMRGTETGENEWATQMTTENEYNGGVLIVRAGPDPEIVFCHREYHFGDMVDMAAVAAKLEKDVLDWHSDYGAWGLTQKTGPKYQDSTFFDSDNEYELLSQQELEERKRGTKSASSVKNKRTSVLSKALTTVRSTYDD